MLDDLLIVLQYGGPENLCKHLELTLAIKPTDYLNRTKNIYTSIFPINLTLKMANDDEISVYFSSNAIVALCHGRP